MTEWLTGWKKIAAYLDVSVRTARNYKKIGLPIYTLSGSAKAKTSELDHFIKLKNKLPKIA